VSRRVTPWVWRIAVRDHAPAKLLLTLYTLGTYLDEHGVAYPAQETLARGIRGCVRTIKSHLKEAKALGWVEIDLAGRGGKGWRHNAYRCTVPDAVAIGTGERGDTAMSPPSNEGGATAIAPASPEGGANRSMKVVQQFLHPNSYSETPTKRNLKSAASRSPADARSAAQEPEARESFEETYLRRFGRMPSVSGSATGSASEPDASPRATTSVDLVKGLARKMRLQ